MAILVQLPLMDSFWAPECLLWFGINPAPAEPLIQFVEYR